MCWMSRKSNAISIGDYNWSFLPFHVIHHNSAEIKKCIVYTIGPLFDNTCLLLVIPLISSISITLENFRESEPYINETESQLFIDILNGKGEVFYLS